MLEKIYNVAGDGEDMEHKDEELDEERGKDGLRTFVKAFC